MTPRHLPDRSGQTAQNATYVYCLVQSAKSPSLRGAPASIPGAGRPRLLAIDRGIWAVVADAPLERFTGEQLQQEMQDVEAISRHAVAHAAVIEFLFRRAPVIPLKLFTLFSSDEKVVAHVRIQLATLTRLFAALRGCEEWGVRVIAGEVEAESARALSSGRDYLQVKKRLNAQTVAPPRATVRTIDSALRSLGALASKTRKEMLPVAGRGRPYAAAASFLVLAKRRDAWKKQAAKLAAALSGEGHRLEMSGPWPPYHFVSK
ncbi:MAG TPA: GvpL/GvpF family gas vesicle protein [Vicinamibacterales bacterium]|nr:GvpL/GvpF family gas vesicle protein [Vicinamibacterales bacterium]